MSQQSDMAASVHRTLSERPVSAAHLVRDLRKRWGPEHGVLAVHGFVREVATCLLWHGDVDLGHVEGGEFVSWSLRPEEANTRIDEELMSMDVFLDDETRYVFRKTAR
jgi:hypothetical protein